MYQLDVEETEARQGLREAWQQQRGFVLGMVVYVIGVTAASIVMGVMEDPPHWLGALLTIPVVGAVGYALFSQRSAIRRREGVERSVYTESTALTFWLVMLSALGWYLLQTWAAAPQLSAIWTWGYGMALWAVVYGVQKWRLG